MKASLSQGKNLWFDGGRDGENERRGKWREGSGVVRRGGRDAAGRYEGEEAIFEKTSQQN